MPVAEISVVHLDANYLVELAAMRAPQMQQAERWLEQRVAVEVSAAAW